MGPACLAREYGTRPSALAAAVAAALRYDCPGDASASRLQEIIRRGGLGAALRDVCGIDPEGELGLLIAAAYDSLGAGRCASFRLCPTGSA